MPMIKQNDVIDVIYDSIYGYSLEEAFKILEDHRKGTYIPVEWLLEKSRKLPFTSEKGMYIDEILEEWEEEQASLFEKKIIEECISAERFADWEKENESRKGEEEK